jgi:nucleoid-associated protein YgaU
VTLQRATIERLQADLTPYSPPREEPVLYNPSELTFSKGAQVAEAAIPGLDSPVLQFVRGQSETLSLELFFDSTDAGTGAGARAVTADTDRFYQLIKIDRELHVPPVCRFKWGVAQFPGTHMTDGWVSQNAGRANGFQCVVESVSQRFTMFSPAGFPLRATLTVALREYKSLGQQLRELNRRSADHTHAYVVQEGDTLAGIAHAVVGDARLWRAIAEANGIEDPLDPPPGAVLEVPPTVVGALA